MQDRPISPFRREREARTSSLRSSPGIRFPRSPDAMNPPTIREVFDARNSLASLVPPTPLTSYPALDAAIGLELYVKHENHTAIGSFKIRGGVYLLSRLSASERSAGIIAASTGNHGQSLAYAGRVLGVPTTIGVPEGANPGKVDSMRALGANILVHGNYYDETRERVEAEAAARGLRYVHAANEPDLIAGVATYALEIFSSRVRIDTLIVPIGGGSGASACCIVRDAIAPDARIIGVTSEEAPASYRSWRERRPVVAPSTTFAEGLATQSSFSLTQSVLRERLDDFVLVSEEDIRRAVRLYLEKTRSLAEGAGAAALAAAIRLRDSLRGRKVGVVLSGGNISVAQLRDVLGAE